MSTDDKANEVSAEAADQEPTTPATQAEATGHHAEEGAGGPIILFFIIGLIASLIVGWVIFPELLYSQKKQPVDFNHALHNEEVENGCESCHFFREDGTYSGVPKLAQCIDCHEEVNGEDPEEEKFVYEYVAKQREVPWLIYSRQPQNVF
ncbi:MAG: cytochrome c3 family protein, partial [Desulfobacteraceae bacterium]